MTVGASLTVRIVPRLAVLLAGTALGVLLLISLLRSVTLDQLGADLADVDYLPLILAIPPFFINMLAKVPRWALLFGDKAPGWDVLFGSMNVGYAINALLPARLGEFVRAYWVRDRTGISMVQTLSTIFLERVTDGLTLIIVLLVMAPTVALPHTLLVPALTLGGAFAVAFAGMIALALLSGRETNGLTRVIRRLEQGRWSFVGRAMQQVLAGLQVLRSRRSLVLVVFYTFLIWSSNSVLVWLVVKAFHVEIPLTAGIVLTVVLNLGMAVPSTPGYVGLFEYLMVLTLGIYGVHHTPALAAALAFHAVAFVPVTVIGLVYIARNGFETTLQILRASATRT